MCAAECRDDGTQLLDQAEWLQRAHALAARGQRVIAIATKAACMKRLASPDDVGEDLVLIGLVGFIDPPREEVKAAVAACKAAGIRVIIITGDHDATPRQIARPLTLTNRQERVSGKMLAV